MWTNRRLLYDKPAQLPTPIWLGNELAVFYSHRVEGRSHIGRLMFDKNLKLLDNDPEILPLGKTGCFDMDGVMPSQVIPAPKGFAMYYSGWYRRDNGLYGHGIGLAFSNDGHKFERKWDGPVVGMRIDLPFLVNSACVAGDQLYFCNGTGWDGLFPTYHIAVSRFHHATNTWIGARRLIGEPDQAVSRPCVQLCKTGPLDLWAAYRTKWTKYKIGHWKYDRLLDEDVLPVRPGEFDSEQTAYPWVFEIDGRSVMVYNGNGYGETGIGIAELV